MPANIEAARESIARCRQLRNDQNPEAVLRIEFASRLRAIFPDPADSAWVNHYTEGTEAATRVGRVDGATANGFVMRHSSASVTSIQRSISQRSMAAAQQR